jgi:hypothetical protein
MPAPSVMQDVFSFVVIIRGVIPLLVILSLRLRRVVVRRSFNVGGGEKKREGEAFSPSP